MTIFNLGSVNADFFYRVPHLPGPGETLAASEVRRGLGGKGANMSVAAARAGARCVHVGAVGADGRWAVERLLEYGVDTRHLAEVETGTGHAVIMVDEAGENAIVIYGGANQVIPEAAVGAALSEGGPGDTLVMQNETNGQRGAAQMAQDLGLRVVYAAAPFDAGAVQEVLGLCDMLVLNEVEGGQLCAAMGCGLSDLPVAHVIETLGARGVRWHDTGAGAVKEMPAPPAEVVDTTGAGDTFTGYFLAGLDRGMPVEQAIGLGMQAAALMVARVGTADVIPDLAEVQAARLG